MGAIEELPADIPSAIYTAPFETFAPRPVPPLVTPGMPAVSPILSVYPTLKNVYESMSSLFPAWSGTLTWVGDYPVFSQHSDWQKLLGTLRSAGHQIFNVEGRETEIILENGQYTLRQLPLFL